MTVIRTRWWLAGVVGAVLILGSGLCGAQSANEGGANLTRQTQNQIDIALPSLAPLVERMMPAVVNISVELKEQAARAGIKQGDVITYAGGHDIKSVHDLPRLVASTPVGSKLPLNLVRGGHRETVEAAISEITQKIASAEGTAQSGGRERTNALAMEMLPLDRQLRKQLKVPGNVNGVAVGHVESDIPAGELGVQPGDVIVPIDQQPVTTPEEAAARLKQAATQGNALLLINRPETSQFVGLSIDNSGTAGSSR